VPVGAGLNADLMPATSNNCHAALKKVKKSEKKLEKFPQNFTPSVIYIL